MNMTMSIIQSEKPLSEFKFFVFGKQPLLISILLLVFLFYSLLAYGAYLVVNFLFEELLWKVYLLGNHEVIEIDHVTEGAIIKSARRFLHLEWAFSCVIWVILFLTVISLPSRTRAAEEGEMKDDLYFKIGEKLKKQELVGFYMTLVSVSLALLLSIFFGLISTVAKGYTLVGLVAFVAMFEAFCFLYVAAVWILLLAVYVLESYSFEREAIEKLWEILEENRVVGCAQKLLLALTGCAIWITYFARTKKSDNRMQMAIAILIPGAFLIFLLNLFRFVMCAHFVQECRGLSKEKSSGEADSGLSTPSPIVHAEV